jgi:hypothetical protein
VMGVEREVHSASTHGGAQRVGGAASDGAHAAFPLVNLMAEGRCTAPSVDPVQRPVGLFI